MDGQRRFGFHRRTPPYGWYFDLGKRIRWNSYGGTSRMWPGFSRGGDENCNRAVTLMLWPLGHLDVWWEPNWRTDADGMCEDCRRELRAA